MEVGPSAAPMIPIDAASLSSNPISDATQIAKKMPNCAAAPNKNMIGCDRSGPKSIIAPIPIKSRIGSASDALIVVSNSHCIIPCVSPMPSVTWLMTPDNGRFTMIAPNPIGRSSAGSYSFLTASQIKSPPIRYITNCCGVIAMTPSHKNSMLFLLLILFSFINILFLGAPCQDTPALAAVLLRARHTSMRVFLFHRTLFPNKTKKTFSIRFIHIC